nr:tRNA (adenosine(37)-N6)-dimethylallyltransferase MiaA [uncultured Desulfobulbus sp.]
MAETQLITAPIIVLVGPTAIGKTALSLEMAARFDCEIISMDSMQVYRSMDIGTAKATVEEREQVVHHLIDIVDPDDQYDAARFVSDALAAIADITSRGKVPLLTGGTGLYLRALTQGLFEEIKVPQELRLQLQKRLADEGREALYRELRRVDELSAQRVHVNDTQRLLRGLEIFQATGIPWSEHIRKQTQTSPQIRLSRMLQLGLHCERELLYERIKTRSHRMMCDAFQQEVERLLAMGYGAELPSMQSIGYRHMLGCLEENWDRPAATAALVQDTRRYAKRQFTWFGRSPDIHWYDVRQPATLLADTEAFLDQN